MKRTAGFIMLLSVLLLVSVPVVADGVFPSNDFALEVWSIYGTKTVIQEEVVVQAVAAPDCEMLAVESVVPIPEEFTALYTMVNVADGSFEPGTSVYINQLVTNYIRSPT